MNLVCQKNILLDYLNIVLKAVPAKSTMSILECILLIADDKGFYMISNTLNMGIITAPIESEIIEMGSVALEAKMLFDIIKKMPDGDISISSDNNNLTILKNGIVEFKILGKPGAEFPLPPEIEKENSFKMSAIALRDMIRQTIFSVSISDEKPIFKGELFEIEKEYINLISVDGFRISFSRALNQTNTHLDDIKVVIPGNTMSELSKILPIETDEPISIFITENSILFSMSTFTLVSGLLYGDFLRYEQSFTNDYKTRIYVNREDLILALERNLLISKDSKKNPVKLKIGNKSIIFTTNTDMGTVYDEIFMEMDGNPLEISFNPKYLLDALKVLDEPKVTIDFNTHLSPCIIKGIDNNNAKFLVLPLRAMN